MNIAAIDKMLEHLKKEKSLLERAEELEVYLDNVDTLEIAVRIAPIISRVSYSNYAGGCPSTHHDALPKPAQEILRTHMREALQTAIHALRAEAREDTHQ